MRNKLILNLCIALAPLGAGAGYLEAAAIPIVLNSNSGASQPVGTRTTWIAAGPSATTGLQYQFSILPEGGAASVLRSFHASSSFEWTPMVEGGYQVIATARDAGGNTGEARASFSVASLLQETDQPGVSASANPLVAIYSAPACSDGAMRIMFAPADASAPAQYTAYKDCAGDKSLNFLVAGMVPDTRYVLQQDWIGPDQSEEFGQPVTFQTGAIDGGAQLAAGAVAIPAGDRTDAAQPVLLTSYVAVLATQSAIPVATDLNGQVLWYYNRPDQPLRYVLRPLTGGTMFVLPKDETLLREIDLVGNTVRETNVAWISEQLQSRFGLPPVTSFHHDAIRLPDGSIAAIASVEKVYNNVQGAALVDILGDAIVVMDPNFNVTWAWNGFDKLDVRRAAVLGDTCSQGNAGCPPIPLAATLHQTTANDWMHSNSLQYVADGNFLLSIRSQDWIVKIDFRNGGGTGAVLWRLGKDGDFRISSTDPEPWFSHQHSAALDGNALWLFDNGNTRHSTNAGANSRGQVLQIDEVSKIVSLTLNTDLGGYSAALGSAQRLDNGDYHFMSGYIMNSGSQSIEVVPGAVPSGAIDFVLGAPNPAYRSFRMKCLSDN